MPRPRRRPEALRAGELSGAQAAAVAEGCAADPGCAEELLETARREPLKTLRERSRAAKAAGSSEEAQVESEETLRRRRFLRTFTGRDGAPRGKFARPMPPTRSWRSLNGCKATGGPLRPWC